MYCHSRRLHPFVVFFFCCGELARTLSSGWPSGPGEVPYAGPVIAVLGRPKCLTWMHASHKTPSITQLLHATANVWGGTL